MEEGVQALLDSIGNDIPVICESNSVASVIEPSTFIIVMNNSEKVIKKSCKKVWNKADGIIRKSNGSFDTLPVDFTYNNKSWKWRRNASAILLAGGRSTRMGRDKSLLEIDGRPLIQHIAEQLIPLFKEVIISSNNPDKYKFLGLPVIKDRVEGRGPLEGLYSSMSVSHYDLNFVTACDIPKIPHSFIKLLLKKAENGDGAVLVNSDGKTEPLFGVYRKSVLPRIEKSLTDGELKVTSFYKKCSIIKVKMPADTKLWNINTEAELQRYLDNSLQSAVFSL